MITVGKGAQLAADIVSRQADVDAVLAAKIAAGFTYQGAPYQIDADSRSNMDAVMTAFALGLTNPHGGAWRTSTNVMTPMTDDQVKPFIFAVKAYYLALLQRSWALKDTLKALTTLAAVADYDITAGWPG